MTLSGKPTLIWFLISASLTILLSGLLLFRNAQISSRHKQHIFNVSPTMHEDQPGYNGQPYITPLSEKRNEDAPKHLIFRKLLGSFERAENQKDGARMLLKSQDRETASAAALVHVDYTGPETHPPKNN